ncbi:2-succinylbenzoate--CoA ligase [Zhongshania aliphaticivorans]|uniref:2-succinylbenzoate--CoA ligase n=1 Tax=Zhongshania aliphaticivorans TaxID=1470434 RepID=A0A5S9PFN5_9GAMM|nr:AMP-binding protein [Zhongshania aliphaticivorans]CAA0102776.1 2-succinylbenzoate--CoA ligase [Zhongshania aliphaticivorans]CAA0113913.1 2-succinylbenzoate--CoA ligase [Zhongshania aliphaticivorans]
MNELLTQLRRTAHTFGERVALSDRDGKYTYSGLVTAVDSLAEELSQRGISRAALLADNSPAWVIADLACLRAGVTLTAIPHFFSAEQVVNALNNCAAEVLISDRAASDPQLRGVLFSAGAVTEFKSVGMLRGFPLTVSGTSTMLPINTVKIAYSSGSTGAPKGVCLSVGNLYGTAEAINDALAKVSLKKHMAVLPLATLPENISGVYAALLRGAEVVVPSLQSLGWAAGSGLDMSLFTDSISLWQPDSLVILPQILKELIAVVEQGGWEPPVCLRYVAVGGLRISSDHVRQARDLGIPVYEGYSVSECGSVVSLNTPEAECLGSAGKILSHQVVDIVDGEVVIKGSLFLAYLGGEALEPGKEFMTGDLGEVDDAGFLWVKGRKTNLITSSYGQKISPEWPESELLAYAGVAQCVIIGDAEAYCSALVFVNPGYSYDDIGRYIRECNQRLPDYAQIRRWAALPKRLTAADGLLTASGRLQREAIVRAYPELVAHCYPGIVYPIGGAQRAFIPSEKSGD